MSIHNFFDLISIAATAFVLLRAVVSLVPYIFILDTLVTHESMVLEVHDFAARTCNFASTTLGWHTLINRIALTSNNQVRDARYTVRI